jgi:phosphatidylglycerol---prolipoprotein diacylglyceryl transferase
MKKPLAIKHIEHKILPKYLAIFLSILGVVFASGVFYPMSQAFSRNWKLNQFITLWNDFRFNINIPQFLYDNEFLRLFLGWESNILTINFGDINLRFYSVCILLGVLSGYFLALYLSKLNFVVGSIVDRLLVGLVVFGLFGARLFFVLFNLDTFASKPIAILTEIGSGGMAISGSIVFGILYVKLYCDRYKFNFFEFLDFLAPAVLLGQIFGRFGNFFNYESYGPETSVIWKMYIPEAANLYGDINARFFHPTFLYEIIPNFFLLIFLLWRYSDSTHKNSGLVFAQYAMGYGLIRFVVEFFRLDALRFNLPQFLQFTIAGFKVEYIMTSQLFAVGLFLLGYVIFGRRRKIIYLKKDMKELYL